MAKIRPPPYDDFLITAPVRGSRLFYIYKSINTIIMNTATIRTIMEMENTLKAVVLIIGNQEADNEDFDRDFADYVELISKGTEHIYKRVTGAI